MTSNPEKLGLIAKIGVASRVHYALTQHPKGLTLEEIAAFTGLALSSIRGKGVRHLYNARLVEIVRTLGCENKYRLKESEIHVASHDSRHAGDR